MTEFDAVVMAITIVLFALVSHRLERWWVTMPIVFVATGAALDLTDVIRLDVATGQVGVLAEVALAVILFGDAVRMNVPDLRRHAQLPARLLLIGLPLTIALGALVTWIVLDGLTFWAAMLVAAVLAPTDAAVGEAIVTDESVPLRIRQALNVEAGLNDGLVVPVVVLCLELLRDDLRSGGDWIRFLVEQIGGGALIGSIVGGLGALALRRSRSLGWIDGLYGQIATLALAVVAFATALQLEWNGFIAAFVAGLAFGAVLDDRTADHLDEYTSDSGVLLAMLSFFVFGNLFIRPAFDHLSVGVVVCALAALTIGRMIPVVIATSFMGLRLPTIGFVGWFGPRGLASIVFGILLLEEELDGADQLFGVIALTVLASVVLHGLSATPLAAAYGRWYSGMAHEHAAMAETRPVVEVRARR